nr:hypothetical protein [Microctonus hyperodae filamentous virus]
MPKAEEFRKWVDADLLPKLCDEGTYDMTQDAPPSIQQAMNVVHQVTNAGASSSWMENDKVKILQLEKQLLEYEMKQIVPLKMEVMELKQQKVEMEKEFQERENKYQHIIKDLTIQANMTLTEFGVQGLLAKDNIEDNEKLRANLRRVKNRVIPELSERPEKEHYAVCYEYEKRGNKRIRVTRNQLAEIQVRDKIMEQCRENPARLIQETNEKIKNEAEPSTVAKRTGNSYTPEDIVNFVKNYTYNFAQTINIYNNTTIENKNK